MGNANYTATDDVSFDQTAWNRLAYFAFRPENHFDQFCDVQPTAQAMPGKVVSFLKIADLAIASTALDESTDVTPVVLSDSTVSVTLQEFGNSVQTTKFLRAVSFVPVNPIVANAIGYNAGVSMDSIVREVFSAGSNVRYAGAATSRGTVIPTSTLAGVNVMRAVADLRGANVPTFNGNYAGIIHPDVSYDFRQATGGANWRDPHTYSQPEGIWNAEIGLFEGVRFLESPRARVFADSGSSTTLTDVYSNLFFGRQAVACAYSNAEGLGRYPQVVDGPVTDRLRRFIPMGWYHIAGYSRFREESLRRVESSSSVGAN